MSYMATMARKEVPPPPAVKVEVKGKPVVIYADEEIEVVPGLDDETAYELIKKLIERGITDPYKIRDILGNTIGIDRIGKIRTRIMAEKKRLRYAHA